MADNMKDSWKSVGTGLGHAFRDLGKTLLKGGATVVKKVDEMVGEEVEKMDAEEPKASNENTAEPVYSEDISDNEKKASK